MAQNNCVACNAPTRERVEISDQNEVVEVAACFRHKAQVIRGARANLKANGIDAKFRTTRFNPKKNKQDRRKFRGDYLPTIPGSTNAAMGPDEAVTK